MVRVLTGKDAEKKYGAVIYDESVLPKRVVRAIDAGGGGGCRNCGSG